MLNTNKILRRIPHLSIAKAWWDGEGCMTVCLLFSVQVRNPNLILNLRVKFVKKVNKKSCCYSFIVNYSLKILKKATVRPLL